MSDLYEPVCCSRPGFPSTSPCILSSRGVHHRSGSRKDISKADYCGPASQSIELTATAASWLGTRKRPELGSARSGQKTPEQRDQAQQSPALLPCPEDCRSARSSPAVPGDASPVAQSVNTKHVCWLALPDIVPQPIPVQSQKPSVTGLPGLSCPGRKGSAATGVSLDVCDSRPGRPNHGRVVARKGVLCRVQPWPSASHSTLQGYPRVNGIRRHEGD